MKLKSIWLTLCFCISVITTGWCSTLPHDAIVSALLPSHKENENGTIHYWYQATFRVNHSSTLNDTVHVFDEALQFTHWDCEWIINNNPRFTINPIQPNDILETETNYFIHAKLTYTGPLELNEKQLNQCRPVVLLVPISGITTECKSSIENNPFGVPVQSKPQPKRINRETVESPINFIFLMMDTLRSDYTPPYDHPFVVATHMEMLANLGTVFTESYGASSSTRPSVGSMMTGLQPYAHGAVRHSLSNAYLYDSIPRMAQIFQQNGFENIGISSNAQVTSAFGFSRGFDDYECPVRENQVTTMGLDYLDKINEPFFLYLHYMAPHDPYIPPHSLYTLYQGQTDYPALDRYCAEITLDDQRIGLILRELAETGMINHSVIWLVSDHGEEFWEHGWNGHGAKLYEESVRTVSILSAPHYLPMRQRIDQPVMHSDMLSTVCDMFDWEAPEIQQGKSLLPMVRNPNENGKDRMIFLHHGGGLDPKPHISDKNGLVLGNHKIIWKTEQNEWELFHLHNDPLEKNNLAKNDLATINFLKPLLVEQLDTTKKLGEIFRSEIGSEPLQPLTDKDIENMRAMGYIE